MAKRSRRWTLLFRMEDGYSVHVYEPLRKYEIDSKRRKGWRVIG